MSPKWVGTNTGATYGMGAITETFRPAVNGTEQSFTVANRPKGSGPLVILVPVLGLSAHTSGAAIDLDNPAGQVVATYAGLKVTDANDKTVPAVMKAVTDGSAIAIDVSDSGASYPLTVDPTWSQTEEIGRSGNVAVLGSTALVGEPDQTVDGNTYEGAVYVYTLSGYGWVESAELTASDGTAGDTFGYSVALSGTSAIIGAPDHTVGSTTYQGAAYVFTFNSGRWTQTAELTNSGGVVEGNFGFSVGLSGTTAVVGAIGMDTTGAAFVFNLSDGSWSQTAVLTPPDYGYIGFGYSVGISGTTLVVGAPGEYVYAADAGTAYIYSLIDGTWTEGATEISSDGGNYELFGEKVAVSGSTVLVSAEGQTIDGHTGQGAAYIFNESSEYYWPESAELTASDGVTNATFGASVAISGTTAVVGAAGQTIDGNTYQGAAYVFSLAEDTWTQSAELTADDGTTDDYLGESVALSGTTALVNSPGNDSTYVFDATTIAPAPSTATATDVVTAHSPSCQHNITSSDPVDCASGDFFHTFTDASIPGYGPVLDLSRTYNSSNASTEGIFGYGWMSSYESNLTVNEDGSITIAEEDGSQVTATPDGTDEFTLPSWADSTLVENEDGSYTFVRQGTETFTYNSSGQLTTIADANGATTALAYSSGKLHTVTDPSGRTLTFAYGDNGLVSTVTDPMSRETTYAYDGSDNLTSVTDPMSHVTSFTYGTGGSAHLLLTMTMPNGQSGGPDAGDTYTNTYDSSGRVLTQTDPMGQETTYAYSGNNFSDTGGTTTITDPDGNATTEVYIDGQMIVSSGSSNGTYSYDQSTFGQTSAQNDDGDATDSSYDADGNQTSSTNALGDTSTSSFDDLNQAVCSTTTEASSECSSLSPPVPITGGATISPPSSIPPPFVTYSQYDTEGNLIWTTTGIYAPGATSTTRARTTYNLYNGESVTLGGTTDSCTTSAPSSELPCATIDADGVVTQLAYDSHGDLTSKSTPDGNDAASPGTLSTFAGGATGPMPGTQLAQQPAQVTTAVVGGVTYAYVPDDQANVVRRINLSTGAETLVAGDYLWRYGGNGGPATDAELAGPSGVAVDSAGDVIIADTYNNVVRFVPAASGTYFGQTMTAGDIYTIAGNNTAGYSGVGGAATSAELSGPQEVAVDSSGIAIADTANNVVRFVPTASGTYFGQAMTADHIYTIAGNNTAGYSGNNGAATSAELNTPGGVAFDSSGDLAIADSANNVVRFVPVTSATYYGVSMTADDIYTIAGNNTAGYSGNNGAATSAELYNPDAVTVDANGDVVIGDTYNSVVRLLDKTSGTHYGQSMTADDIYTIAGNGSWGNSGSGVAATSAEMAATGGVATDAAGDVVIADTWNYEVRVVAASSGTLAGESVTADDLYDLAGTDQYSDSTYSGPPADAEFDGVSNVRTDAAGDVVLTDSGTNTIRFVPAASGTYFGQSMTAHDIYTVAGDDSAGYSGDDGAATSAKLNGPEGVALDASGDLAIADSTNNAIRFVPATSGTYFGQSMTADHIYTIAGDGTEGSSGDGGAATSAKLGAPYGVTFDGAGDLVIADGLNDAVRFVPKSSGTHYGQSMTADDIYTIAGQDGESGYWGNGGPATSGKLSAISFVTVDANGDLVIPDSDNAAVRFVPATSGTYYGVSMTADDIYTIAGDGTAGYSGNGGPATSAELADYVGDATVDAAGNLLIADTDNDVIRFVPKTSGTYYGQTMTADDIYTVAGAGWGTDFTTGDGGSPLDGTFGWALSVTPDGTGGFYVADDTTGRIRHVSVGDTSGPDATTTYTYNTDGEQTAVTSPDGNIAGANAGNYTTVNDYNDDGELTSSAQGDGDGATVTARTTSYGYDGDGNQTTVTDPRGYETTTAYNADDEPTLVTDPDSDATLTCYDGDGHVVETVPPVGVAANSLTASSCPTGYPSDYGDRLASDATTTAYNALGQKTTVTTPAPAGLSGHETTTYSYDPASLLTSVTAPPTSNSGGAADDVTDYTYDDAGELLTTTTGAGTATAATTSYCYDPEGNKVAVVAPDGNTSSVAVCSTSSPYETSSAFQTSYAYDSLGELVAQTTPDTSAAPSGGTTTYSYDPAGNELTSENPDGVTATDTYTPLDQAATVSYSDSTPAVSYSYDANGNRTTMTDGSGITTSSYDPFDELTSTTDGAGATTSYGYDLDGDVRLSSRRSSTAHPNK